MKKRGEGSAFAPLYLNFSRKVVMKMRTIPSSAGAIHSAVLQIYAHKLREVGWSEILREAWGRVLRRGKLTTAGVLFLPASYRRDVHREVLKEAYKMLRDKGYDPGRLLKAAWDETLGRKAKRPPKGTKKKVEQGGGGKLYILIEPGGKITTRTLVAKGDTYRAQEALRSIGFRPRKIGFEWQ